MNCREFVDFVMNYLDDALTADQRALFEEHIENCPECVVYLDTYRETVRLEGELLRDPFGPVPADVPEDLVNAILAARRR